MNSVSVRLKRGEMNLTPLATCCVLRSYCFLVDVVAVAAAVFGGCSFFALHLH